jgi:hypothetical protein
VKLPELGIIALTPAAWTGNDYHPGIAIAAARAGAIGVLDLEYIDEAGGAELVPSKSTLSRRSLLSLRQQKPAARS